MRFRGLLRIVGLAAIATSANAQDREPLAASLQAIRDASQVPALAALVALKGQVVDAAAVGVRKQGDPTPVVVTDPFHLGSDTKAMTATLVAMLVDEGKLTWTSTLHELMPDITTMAPAFSKVTIEMLLAHRSGLGSEGAFDQGGLFRRMWTPGLDPVEGRRMVAREMLSAPPDVAPGSVFATATRITSSRAASSRRSRASHGTP